MLGRVLACSGRGGAAVAEEAPRPVMLTGHAAEVARAVEGIKNQLQFARHGEAIAQAREGLRREIKVQCSKHTGRTST
jgi:hypothetical protein